MGKLLEVSIDQLTSHLEKGKIIENEIALNKILDELSQLQQDNQKLNDSITQSNLAKINALLKVEQLQQEKEELIKWLEDKKNEYYSSAEDNVIKNITLTQVLNKLKGDDKEC